MEKPSQRLAKKSLNIALAALEIYNKPDYKYREETFCILMINAFELLFKAKIVLENDEKIRALYVYERKRGKNNIELKQQIIKRNRIGEPYTLEINKCMNLLLNQNLITNNIKENIDILIEVRDNAIHFLNKSENLKIKVYSICAASIRNFSKLLSQWFKNIKIENYNFFITPLNFDTAMKSYDVLNEKVAEKNFVNYVDSITASSEQEDEFDILINVDIKLSKNNIDEAVLLRYANEGKRINIELNDEIFKRMYPYTNDEIIKMIKKKNPSVKQGKKLNEVKKILQENEICCKARYLDVVNKKGSRKYYYNSNFVDKFLELYIKD